MVVVLIYRFSFSLVSKTSSLSVNRDVNVRVKRSADDYRREKCYPINWSIFDLLSLSFVVSKKAIDDQKCISFFHSTGRPRWWFWPNFYFSRLIVIFVVIFAKNKWAKIQWPVAGSQLSNFGQNRHYVWYFKVLSH